MAKLVMMKKGGGGRVAINPEHVTHVRSATGAFTDVFFNGQQVAVEGTFEEVVARLSGRDPKEAKDSKAGVSDSDRRIDPGGGLVFGRLGR